MSEQDYFDPAAQSQKIALVFAETNARVTSSTGASAYESSLSEVVDFISKQGSKTLIVSGTPDYTLRPEEVGRNGKAASLAEVFLAPHSGRDFGETVSRSGFLERHGPFIAVEEGIAQSREGVALVSGYDMEKQMRCDLDPPSHANYRLQEFL